MALEHAVLATPALDSARSFDAALAARTAFTLATPDQMERDG
jgi:hypothetical protein